MKWVSKVRRNFVLQNLAKFGQECGVVRNDYMGRDQFIEGVAKKMPEIVLQMVDVAMDYGLVPFYLTDDGGAFEQVEEAWENGEPIPIWTGASDGSIWGSRLANWFFRVWHDSIHVKEDCGFGLEGEIEAAIHHMKQASAKGYQELAAVCWIEIVGQASYLEANGEFPPQSYTRKALDDMGLTEVGAM